MNNRLTLLVSVPLFLVLAVAVYLTVTFSRGEQREQAWVVHTYEAIDALRTVLADAADAETGQRGYLLTKKPEFLTPYHAARVRIHAGLARFESLVKDNPRQLQRARELRALIEDRLAVLESGLNQPKDNMLVPAPLVNLLAEGRDTMERLRGVVSAGLEEERQLLQQRIENRRAVERNQILSAALAALLALAVLLLAAGLLIRNNARLKVSEALRQRQARMLQATLDNIRDGVLVFDETDKVAAFNNVFFRLMDFPERLAALGATLDAFREFDGAQSRRSFDQALFEAQNHENRYERFVRGERELDVYHATIPGEGFLVAAADVTARIRAEAAMRQSQKMEAVGQLTGGVAHDFNNLLQIISANLDLATNEGRKDPKLAERLQNAISAVERGSRLTAQLLAFARRQALEPRSIDLARLLQEMTDLLRRTLGERIEVESMVAGGLWNTLADPNQLENAILNLAINARDAMPDGGRLTIEIANAFLDDEYAAHHAEVSPGQYVMLAISDTGEGMTPDVAARVFDPFFTTKPEGKGTGLGLSQVYGFVKQSGGHVKIYSEPGHGTTVKLYLPRTRRPQELLEPVPATDSVGGSETILVVEDDEGVRAAVVDILSDLGYAVLKAGNAEQALAVLQSGATVDLLFTDVVMPGPLNTREFVRMAQAMHPHMKVLFTSGYTQNAIVHNGKLDDDATLLSKPYRKDVLARKLRILLDDAPLSPPPLQNKAKGKVLVVEDVELIRMTTVDMVEEIGFTVVDAGDGEAALALLESDWSITVMVTDLGLPGMSGMELIAQARVLRPELRIVVASGHSSHADQGALGDVQLMKPFDLTQLRKALLG